MYSECPKCLAMVKMPDSIKDENQFELTKCYNCKSDLSYLDKNSLLLEGNLIVMQREKIIEKEKIIKKLKDYENLCDEAIDLAREAKIKGGINWDDLKCNDVRYSISAYGIEKYDFYIDEDSTDNYVLKHFIYAYIKEKTREKFIEIFTE